MRPPRAVREGSATHTKTQGSICISGTRQPTLRHALLERWSSINHVFLEIVLRVPLVPTNEPYYQYRRIKYIWSFSWSSIPSIRNFVLDYEPGQANRDGYGQQASLEPIWHSSKARQPSQSPIRSSYKPFIRQAYAQLTLLIKGKKIFRLGRLCSQPSSSAI